jgi:PAS domain S-box-containing protein
VETPVLELPVQRAARGEEVRNYEQEYVLDDGTRFTMFGNATPLRDAEGHLRGSVSAFVDITERKQAQLKLEQSLSLLRATLESTADGILVVDSNGKFTSYNHKFQEMWGIPESVLQTGADDQVLAYVLDKLLDPDSFICCVKSLYEKPESESFDIIKFIDGRTFERYSQPQRIDGRIVGRVWSFRDITERKQAEAELQKKNAEIEQFIYIVSHDLRSPLVTVKTFLGFLESDIAGSNQARISQDLLFIHSAANKMKLLLDELLEMSRIGRVETTPVRVSLIEVMQEALGALAGVIYELNAEIHLPDTNLMLFGDRPRFCQIWQNLIENAIKYSREDTIPRIELGVQQMNGETVFFVKDSGIGIDPNYHSKIFGIFEKLDHKSSGAGLGLSMVQRIVEKCGGRIWVESEGVDKGSCFLFTLPHVVAQN